MAGLLIGQRMLPKINRPNVYRGRFGEILLGLMGFVLSILMFFFLFRLFWDNGLWGILQLLIVSIVVGFVVNRQFVQSGVVPIICSLLGVAQAIKIT